jgi:hypothetical protein
MLPPVGYPSSMVARLGPVGCRGRAVGLPEQRRLLFAHFQYDSGQISGQAQPQFAAVRDLANTQSAKSNWRQATPLHDGGWPRRSFSGRRSTAEGGSRSQSGHVPSPRELRLALRAPGSGVALLSGIRMGCEFARLLGTDGASQGGVPRLRKEAVRTLVEQRRRSGCEGLIGADARSMSPADGTRLAAIKVLARAA